MPTETKKAAATRVAKIEGQVRAVSKMLAEDRYCIDVVRQIQAAKAALSSLETLVIEDHVNTCVQHALVSDDVEARRDKVDELVAILSKKKR